MIIEGMANTTDRDRTGDIITAEAWKGGIANFQNNPVLLNGHNGDQTVGSITKLEPRKNGLFIEAQISDTETELQAKLLEGMPRAFSVGFQLKDMHFDKETDTSFITALELLEISVVSVPANQNSLFKVVQD